METRRDSEPGGGGDASSELGGKEQAPERPPPGSGPVQAEMQASPGSALGAGRLPCRLLGGSGGRLRRAGGLSPHPCEG